MSQIFKCVGLQIIAAELALMIGLAKKFKSEFNSRIILYVRSDEEVLGFQYLIQDGTADDIINCELITSDLRDNLPVSEGTIEQARAWEERLGETITTLTFEHRQLSRGFFTGGLGNPRSPIVERAGYEQVLAAVCKTLDFWERQFTDQGVTLIINAEKFGATIARSRGIPYRRLFSAKFDGDHFWSVKERTEFPDLKHTFDSNIEFDELGVQGTYFAQTAKLKKSKFLVTRSFVVKSLISAFTIGAYRSYFGSRRGQVRIRDMALSSFRARANFQRYQRVAQTNLKDLIDTPYVYFPLHKEPETYMLVSSPEYFNQMAAIIALSKALPAGWRLALKEHVPAFALRDNDFYNRLLDLKNVSLMPVDEPSIDIAQSARAVATITGAAGLEASVFGIPAIQFGRHMINRFLPHVFTVGDDNNIREFIQRVELGEIDRVQAREDGARFRAALDHCCFKMPDFMLDFRKLSDGSIEAAFENLIDGIQKEKGGLEPL